MEDNYVLEIQSIDEAWVLENVTLTILNVFLTSIKSKRLDSPSESPPLEDRILPKGVIVDSLHLPSLLDTASLPPILSVMRHMLFSKQNSTLSANLLMHLKLSPVTVLNQLFIEWITSCPSSMLVGEAAVLVVRATQQYLSSKDFVSNDYEAILLSLLHSSLIDPPRFEGANSYEEGRLIIRNLTLQPLLDCVKSISKRQEHKRSSLDSGVLRIIHKVIYTTFPPQFIWRATTYCITSGAFHSLFSCLEDVNLSGCTIGILGGLLRADKVGQSIGRFGRICESAKASFSEDDAATNSIDEEKEGEVAATQTPAGTKRKRTSPRRKKPVPLEPLEMSPSVRSSDKRVAVSHGSGSCQPCFWDSEVKLFIQKALCAGRRLESKTLQDESLSDVSIKDLLLVFNALRLILDCLRNDCGQNNGSGVASCLDVALVLLTNLQACCKELLNSQDTKSSQRDVPLTEVMVSAGVYLYFSLERFTRVLDVSQIKCVNATLESFSLLGNRIATAQFGASSATGYLETPLCSHRGILHSLRLLGFQSLKGGDEIQSENGCRALSCPCSVLADARFLSSGKKIPLENKERFAFDCGLLFFDLLPLLSRCVPSVFCILLLRRILNSLVSITRSYLLISLQLPGRDLHFDAGLTDIILSNMGQASSPSSTDSMKQSLQCAISFVPLLLLTQARVKTSKFNGDLKERLEYLLNDSLEKVFEPVVKNLDPSNDSLIETLMWTFRHLKMTHSQTTIGNRPDSLLSPKVVLDYFFGFVGIKAGEVGVAALDVSDDPLRSLGRMMFSVAQTVEENNKSASVRALRWECIASLCLDCPGKALRRLAIATQTEGAGADTNRRPLPSLFWLLSAPFSEADAFVRRGMAESLNKVLMADNHSLLLSLFASDDDIEAFAGYTAKTKLENIAFQNANDLTNASERAVSALFRALDSLLLEVCSLAESQLSFTMTRTESVQTPQKDRKGSGDTIMLQRSAVKILGSLCANANLDDPVGVWFFEKALIRLMRMWAATPIQKTPETLFPDLPTTPATRALAFGELAKIFTSHALPLLVSQRLSETFAASMFCDILILSSSSSRETQYTRLASFIRLFMTGSQGAQSKKLLSKDMLGFIEEQLPAIVCQFVVEKDIELLRLTAGFKDYLEESNKYIRKKSQLEMPLVGCSNAPPRRKMTAFAFSNQELERKARHLCLQPRMIERILPLVLINADRSGLVFFLSNVLSGISLREIIQNREQLILKELVWQLGKNVSSVGSPVQAIRVAATALMSEAGGTKRASSSDDSLAKDPSLASKWVTSHFMYLLVNVIQYRWKSRTRKEQLHAMSCLRGLLNFLLPAESAQYFPQIMATVSAASNHIGFNMGGATSESADFVCLHLFAIKCLSKFVRLVGEHQIEAIAMNLTTIVVSLIPVLGDGHPVHWALHSAQDEAISLLEYLTSGSIGQYLSNYFKEIPFLPQLPSLKSVHDSLRSNNVDFDNLVVLSSGTQRGGSSRRESMTSDTSHTMGSKSTTASSRMEKVGGLQKRLQAMALLLDSENTSVRNVVLEHLIDLLRANRDVFHVLIESEGYVSTRNCLTVMYPLVGRKGNDQNGNNWLPRGAVVNLLEKLLSRCVEESDGETRILLATCLGECGAIGEHQLADLNIGAGADAESVDSPNSDYQWRLEQPPWQSRAAKYELQLVTKHLAVALKSAPSSSDQHKVAFTIQQLLVLLDRSARQEGEAVVKGTRSSKEMSVWLRDKLNDSGVYEVVEPFWFSEFHEKVRGSTAVRTQAGLSMTEFIFPLLILDRLCFGSRGDEEAIRTECLAILSFDSSSSGSMNQSDYQRAVSSLFAVMETLAYWAEREIEDRFRSSGSNTKNNSRRRSTSNKVSEDVASEVTWLADKTVSRIEDLLTRIPLSVQAGAAARVGMHARALRLLEMEGRKQVVEEVFESNVDRQLARNAPSVRTSSLNLSKPTVGHCSDVTLLKDILARLDDCDTMAAIGGDSFAINPVLQVRDSIRQKEASGDYEGALRDYERALQLQTGGNRDPSLEKGILQCLLELGQFESVLNQVGGLAHGFSEKRKKNISEINSFAVEAAWRLGRWDTLSALVEEEETRSGMSSHQISIGKAMVGLQRKDKTIVASALKSSRAVIMDALSSGARESYSRSYSNIVQLHCIREMENAADILCLDHSESPLTLDEIAQSTSDGGWAWDGRLNLMTAQGASSVISTRVALARLCGEPALEGSLFFSVGKRARKRRLFSIAETFFSKAQAALTSIPAKEVSRNLKLGDLIDSTKVQVAKLKHESGESALALRILGQESVQATLHQMLGEMEDSEAIKRMAVDYERQRLGTLEISMASGQNDEKTLTDRFAKRLLRVTQWTVEGGLKGGSEITRRYRIIHKLAPEWEKGQSKSAPPLSALSTLVFQLLVLSVCRSLFIRSVHPLDNGVSRQSPCNPILRPEGAPWSRRGVSSHKCHFS
eukprot:scaffold14008_cov124-Cylindrotheca_fusiformis.AAC.9